MAVTIEDVAGHANVSHTTVSLVLRNKVQGRVSDETAARVRQVMRELNYQPNVAAQSMRLKSVQVEPSPDQRTHNIGCLFYIQERPGMHPYYADVLVGANEASHQLGQHLLMGHGHSAIEDVKKQLLFLTGRKVDGWLLGASAQRELLEYVRETRIPTVWAGSSMAAGGVIPQVRGDDFQGGYLATQHLVELGHRRIAYVDYGYGAAWTEPTLGGCRQALREAGIADLVCPPLLHRSEPGQLQQIVAQLLENSPRPTAVFVRGDIAAVEIMRCLAERGLDVPGEVSVVGYDDLGIAALSHPPLTTIAAPRHEIGEIAARRLVEMIEAPEELFRKSYAETVLPVRLVERGSVAPPPK